MGAQLGVWYSLLATFGIVLMGGVEAGLAGPLLRREGSTLAGAVRYAELAAPAIVIVYSGVVLAVNLTAARPGFRPLTWGSVVALAALAVAAAVVGWPRAVRVGLQLGWLAVLVAIQTDLLPPHGP